MSAIADAAKRLLIGRPVRTSGPGVPALPKRIALPVFAADSLSTVAYAPDEILLTLALAGFAATTVSPWVGLAVVLVLVVVVASYRQNVRAYPDGGGDYAIVTENLGQRAGVVVASALLVDYALMVAVSVSSGAQFAAAIVPDLRGHETAVAAVAVAALVLLNLRGLRRPGRAVALPVYAFMLAVGLTVVVGLVQHLSGGLARAESAGYDVVPASTFDQGLVGLAGAVLIARAFASGSVALTGVETVSTGVPAFTKPRGRNAATTLTVAAAACAAMLLSILLLARATGVRYVEDPARQLLDDAGEPLAADHVQVPVLGQVAGAVFDGFPAMVYVVLGATALILLFAANSAFHGFPALGALLARDDRLPRRLRSRGDRLAHSNGIVLLAIGALALVWVFDARVTQLIQLYIVGVFASFTLSQLGMVRHWVRMLRLAHDPRERARMRRARAISWVGLVLTGVVLVVVLVSKFWHGAWIAVLAIAGCYVVMGAVHRHYAQVDADVELDDDVESERALPSRVHGLVLVSRVHRPALRALAYARATRPSVLEAVTVAVDADATAQTVAEWERLTMPVPLRVLDSPFRDIAGPVVGYVRSIRRSSPRDLVVVFLPEYVVGHWWEHLLHNQGAMRLRSRLLFTPGVVVATVPWRLESARRRSVPVAPPEAPEPDSEDEQR